jgi:amino acid transporter
MLALLFASIIDTVGFWAVAVLIVCGIVAIAYIILRVLEVQPPPWLIQILWVIVAIVIGVLAIGFLVSLGGGQPTLWLRGR